MLRNIGSGPFRGHNLATKARQSSKLGTKDYHLQHYILDINDILSYTLEACPIIRPLMSYSSAEGSSVENGPSAQRLPEAAQVTAPPRTSHAP